MQFDLHIRISKKTSGIWDNEIFFEGAIWVRLILALNLHDISFVN